MKTRLPLLVVMALLLAGLGSIAAAAEGGTQPQPRKTVRLLTVGNSFSGNATQYLGDLAKAAGHVLIHRQAAIGGGTLAQHWEKVEQFAQDPHDPRGLYPSKRSLQQELAAERWDFVTIQQASILSHDVSTYRPFARQLHDFIKQGAPQAEVLLHQTREYRRDDPRFLKPPLKPGEPASQQAMYEGLTRAYETIAKELGLRIIPVGDAFHAADTDPTWGYRPDPRFESGRTELPALPEQTHSLHVGWRWITRKGEASLSMDGHHANTAGQYLAACVFYEFLFQESVMGNPFLPKGLDEADARYLRKTAHEAVVKSRAAHAQPAAAAMWREPEPPYIFPLLAAPRKMMAAR